MSTTAHPYRELHRLAIRRDRVLVPVWLAVLLIVCFASAAAVPGLYATEAERVKAAEAINASPGIVALYRKALATVDLTPREEPCSHREGHPGVKLADPPRPATPDERGELCPRRVAEQVHAILAYTDDYMAS